MTDSPGGIDQLKLPRTVPGLGENLLTVSRPAAGVARVRCQLCGCEVGCRVIQPRTGGPMMSETDVTFWLSHMTGQHPEVFPADVLSMLDKE